MFLESLELSIIQPCNEDINKIKAKAIPSRNIDELFPYLSSYLKTSIYNREDSMLIFNYKSQTIKMYKSEIIVLNILNEKDVFEILDYIKRLINECDDKRQKIILNEEIIKLPTPIDLYEYLPKINCGKCGVSTCLDFATKLINGSYRVSRCMHLNEVGNEENKKAVEDLLLLLKYNE